MRRRMRKRRRRRIMTRRRRRRILHSFYTNLYHNTGSGTVPACQRE